MADANLVDNPLNLTVFQREADDTPGEKPPAAFLPFLEAYDTDAVVHRHLGPEIFGQSLDAL
jgi:hypothetical protein